MIASGGRLAPVETISTAANLPPSAKLLTGKGNEWQGSQDLTTREETYSWKCLYAEGNAFYNALIGSPQAITSGGVTVTRRVPLQNPFNPALWATKYAWQGIDGPGKPNSTDPFLWVIFKVTFGYPGYSVDGGSEENSGNQSGSPPFIKVSARGGTRTVTDTARQYSYTPPNGTAVKLKHDVGVTFGGTVYEVQLFAIPDVTAWQQTVAPLVGKVNSQPFNVGTFQRAAGTVLLENYGYDYDQDVAGNAQWTGSVTLNCSSLPWNSYLVGGQIVTLSPTPYQTTDLNALYM